jgi:hypothetical protein
LKHASAARYIAAEVYLAAVQIKPVIFTLPGYKSSVLFFVDVRAEKAE